MKSRELWRHAASQDDLVRQMAQAIEPLPGMKAIFTQPIEMRVNEMIAGVRADFGVLLFGEDFDVLKAKAREVQAALEAVPGAADVTTEQLTGQPLLEVAIDWNAVARHGVPAREVLDAVEALGGRTVGRIQEGERRFPIAVRLADRFRSDAEALGRVLVVSGEGRRIPLARLTKMRSPSKPQSGLQWP
ncbi:MAG: efflux RND transporter permease subunit [Candidatus Wallbacteria bacterium]|nr:efflux RND transporter permease subunit [Candidatus Wallbacteria bacterium]